LDKRMRKERVQLDGTFNGQRLPVGEHPVLLPRLFNWGQAPVCIPLHLVVQVKESVKF
jgi:hypothetical protein